MNLKKLFFAAVIVLSANATFAQDTNVATHTVAINIAEVALLDLEVASGTTAITLAGTNPTEAGLPMTFGAAATNESIWMNYSSILGNETSRSVTVAITAGDVPTGLKLTVLASAASVDGAGTKGTPLVAAHTLTGIATSLVSGIGSTYTGDGASKGHKLTYQLGYATDAATDYADLDLDNSDVLTITYTLTDI
jgi:hypothetical protein